MEILTSSLLHTLPGKVLDALQEMQGMNNVENKETDCEKKFSRSVFNIAFLEIHSIKTYC